TLSNLDTKLQANQELETALAGNEKILYFRRRFATLSIPRPRLFLPFPILVPGGTNVKTTNQKWPIRK
ncbi:MAG: hypothetical protein L7R66_03705, partial [Candidatus Thalassarchaeaceae archaeon]|nr:hypothetical protein [Candidatus Thalassarchaeaceae archaeon]